MTQPLGNPQGKVSPHVTLLRRSTPTTADHISPPLAERASAELFNFTVVNMSILQLERRRPTRVGQEAYASIACISSTGSQLLERGWLDAIRQGRR